MHTAQITGYTREAGGGVTLKWFVKHDDGEKTPHTHDVSGMSPGAALEVVRASLVEADKDDILIAAIKAWADKGETITEETKELAA